MNHNKIKSWKTLKIQNIYDCPWFRIEKHDVITPAGTKGVYNKICSKCRVAGIIPLDKDNNTWIVGQTRYVVGDFSWEIPMGGTEKGESLLEAAKRELREETGLEAKNWEEIMHFHTAKSVCDESGIIYLATNITERNTNFCDTEDIIVKKMPFLKLVDMVMNGEISDTITIASVLKCYVSKFL